MEPETSGGKNKQIPWSTTHDIIRGEEMSPQYLGSGAVVLPSIVIGDDVIVGAGSVVNANLQESGTYAGIPARKIP